MMRNLESNRTHRSPAGVQIVIVGICTGVLLLVGYFFRPVLAAVVTPLFAKSASTSQTATRFLSTVEQQASSLDALIAENNELKTKLAASEIIVLDRNQLYEENSILKEQWGRSAEPNRLLAAVLVRPGATPYDTLILDVGEQNGVHVGDPVSAGGSVLVGKIKEVFARTSVVLLYSSPGETYDGFLRGVVPIQVVGQGAGSLTAEVPYDAKAVEGDSVTLPMLEANTAFIVEHVELGQGNSSVHAYMRLPVSPFSLRFVEVWRQTN